MSTTMPLDSVFHRPAVQSAIATSARGIARAWRWSFAIIAIAGCGIALALCLKLASAVFGLALPTSVVGRAAATVAQMLAAHPFQALFVWLALMLVRPDIGVAAAAGVAGLCGFALVLDPGPFELTRYLGFALFVLAAAFVQQYVLRLSHSLQRRLWARAQGREATSSQPEGKRQDADVRRVQIELEDTPALPPTPTLAPQGDGDAPAEPHRVVNTVRAPNITFADLHGLVATKAELLSAAEAILHSADGVRDPKSRKRASHGIFLSGPPGNGKTQLCEALAGQLRLNFMSFSVSDVTTMWQGEPTQRLVQFLRDAHAQAPCVLLIDEIEQVARNRSDANLTNEAGTMTAALLTEIDKLKGKGVIVMAATNYPQKVDPAVRREGRFDFWVRALPPDLPARLGIIRDVINREAPRAVVVEEDLQAAVARMDGFGTGRILAIGSAAARIALSGKPLDRHAFMRAVVTTRRTNGLATGGALDLDDLVLSPQLRESAESLCARMSDPVGLERKGASLPRGVLMLGPSGTGKTSLASAIAKRTGWEMFATSGTELLQDTSKLEELVERAKDARPAIIFIDEAAVLLGTRRGGGLAAATDALLVAMDGVGSARSDVVWFAALNDYSDLDPATIRGKRFEEKLSFDHAVGDQVLQLLENALADKDWTIKDPEHAVQVLTGMSAADIGACVQAAINKSVHRAGDGAARRQITASELEEALGTVRLI